ncbi:MAG: hypothetical protein BGO69_04170 [Bacteroidetes bacterium 46-16]|nr:MAG: hypothetical protein BGO69_04170 [Bacteroidetes bacterium 46-16]
MMMTNGPYKKRLIILSVTIIAAAVIPYIFSVSSAGIAAYSTYIFRPVQHLRNKVFSYIPFSAGDVLYLLLGVSLLALIAKWIFIIIRIARYKEDLITSLIRSLLAAALIYLLFFIGWGGNYNQPPLSDSWQLEDTSLLNNAKLYAFDSSLVDRLNQYAPAYHPLHFGEAGRRAATYYREYSDLHPALSGLKVKPALYGNLLEYMGVQGYYNPFTGEAQVNSNLPAFVLPFVICHELAHQAGIAAEDDANLLAYAIGTRTEDSTFRYSCYFNLWLYAHSRLKMEDTSLARELYKKLNKTSITHLDTLRAINRRYRSKLSRYSNDWYDSYLRFHHVKDGIKSYDDVVQSAYAWEQLYRNKHDLPVHIP